MDKIRIFYGEDGQTYATIIAGNGEPIFTSEGHENAGDVRDVVATHFPGVTVDDETLEPTLEA